ncbi:antibiotic biosynthesis monooxygenase [Mycoplasma sp. 394]
MIYTKATQYIINPEKMKGFIDYLYVFTQKTRMQETNLSFEYGIQADDKILVIERWSNFNEFDKFIKNPEFAKELQTLSKMSKAVNVIYQLSINR